MQNQRPTFATRKLKTVIIISHSFDPKLFSTHNAGIHRRTHEQEFIIITSPIRQLFSSKPGGYVWFLMQCLPTFLVLALQEPARSLSLFRSVLFLVKNGMDCPSGGWRIPFLLFFRCRTDDPLLGASRSLEETPFQCASVRAGRCVPFQLNPLRVQPGSVSEAKPNLIVAKIV